MSIRDNWRRAQALAERTPVRRNRSVDFLRAASICVVVIGHWLMAAAYLADGRLRIGDMLEFAPWTQWLTWAFQVMPLFFMVGGYANGVSWQSATRKGIGYHLWLSARLQRLLGPVVPLLLVWVLLAAAGSHAGIAPDLIRVGSQASFTPTWFLAVYIMVVVTTPLTWRAWRRFGPSSFAVLALCAAAVDTLSFILDMPLLRWINYAFVWLAVHQLGYLWRDRRILGPGQALLWAIGGFAALALLVTLAGYPVSMITVGDEPMSNSRPPTLALLSLAVFHGDTAAPLAAAADAMDTDRADQRPHHDAVPVAHHGHDTHHRPAEPAGWHRPGFRARQWRLVGHASLVDRTAGRAAAAGDGPVRPF